MPTGPVTHGKAWIEMIHRYLAMAVGALILVAAGVAWLRRADLPHSPWWATVTLVWVILQGLFGKYTVTLKLYPAIVTLHLLGALLLLGLLVLQHVAVLRRRDLEDDLAPIGQPDAGGGVEPAFFQLAHGLVHDRRARARDTDSTRAPGGNRWPHASPPWR